jgi:hypothetical protein
VRNLGRLENPVRYWVWYEPAWYLGLDTLETMPAYVATYDSSGREISPRKGVAPRPGLARETQPRTPPVEASAVHAWSGLLTSPVEAALLVGATRHGLSEVRASRGAETGVMLQVLIATTQYFLPGVRWYTPGHTGLVLGCGVTMFFVALVCGLACLVLARRHAFSRASIVGWALLGCMFGSVGLVLMLALHEWPARIPCLKCRQPRVVTRDRCEYCGAAHTAPKPDGTEIFERKAAIPPPALAAR